MRKVALKLIVCAIAATFIAGKEAWELQGPEYEALKASDKHQQIWEKVIETQESNKWLGTLGLAGFLAESMVPTVTWIGDTI